MNAAVNPVVDDSARPMDWTEFNQRHLLRELARIKAVLGAEGARAGAIPEPRIDAASAPPALDRVMAAFSLSPFERDVLLLCAGVEMDSEFARRCAQAHGDLARPWASFGLALGALEAPHWSAITPSAPLRRWRLIEVEEGAALVSARLRIDERILHFLAGINDLDTRLRSLLHPLEPAATMAASHRRIAEAAVAKLESRHDFPRLIYLTGDDSAGAEQVAAWIAVALGCKPQRTRLHDLPAGASELDALATLWARETVLLPAALCLRADGETPSVGVLRFVEDLNGLVIVISRESIRLSRPALRYEINLPDADAQRELWRCVLADTDIQVEGVAAQFRLSAEAIAQLGQECGGDANMNDGGQLWDACRALTRPRLDELTQRITALASWDDLVLPDSQKNVLREIAAQVRHRLTVYETWGFARSSLRGLGIGALFTGESGTGKTMAAEVLANELRMDLYRIDLSAVVSKYIGETEKNLRRIFDAAENAGAILLFDEADALFGKRSEVKDSHDRYANIEVSYLLQRMEAYRGLAVLTTNLKSALDPAFRRRLRFAVHFPFPNAEQREAIWRHVFPRSAPVAGLDYAALSRLHAAGGGIRNIALRAAFLAAGNGEPVSMAQLLYAARSESLKLERPLSEAETRGWT